MKLWHTAS